MEGIIDMEKYEKRLSIIVPVYNVEKYLERCVDSLLKQDIDKADYEIILVNDGSTDNSYEIAKRLSNENENIILLTQENKGLSGARNTGLERAVGKYIMFVDSDDMLFHNVISKILNTAENNKLDVCAYRIIYYDADGNKHNGSIQPFAPHKIYDGRYALTHGADIGAVWLNLYSREMLEQYHLRFLDKIYHEDVDFNLRMYAYADRMMFTDIIAYCYWYNESALSRVNSKAKLIKHITDDLTIVRHIRDFSKTDERGKILKGFYNRHGNSLVVACLLRLCKEKALSKTDKLTLFESAKTLKIYPVKGRTLSWKTSVMLPFLNIEWLYRIFLNRES